MELGRGSVLRGRYRLQKRLGQGAMGEVWQAADHWRHREVAVKLMGRQLRRDQVSWERFRREADYQSGLRHPGITAVHAWGDHEGQPFIVMELLTGHDLYTMMQTEFPGGLPVDLAVGLAAQAAEALAYLHDSGIVHRDIKPSNLFVAADGQHGHQVKVCDFGVAKSLGDAPITHAGTRLGTWAYLAPEIWEGQPATARTDLYALGCVLHEMLTGRPLFPVRLDDEHALLRCHLHQPPPPLSTVVPVPVRLGGLVSELLEKNPEARPKTARDVADQLQEIAASLRGQAPPTIVDAHGATPGGYPAPAPAAVQPRGKDPMPASGAVAGQRPAASGQPAARDSPRLWTWAVRASAWLVFLTTAALCAIIAARGLAPLSRLFVLGPAAAYTLAGALAVSRVTVTGTRPAALAFTSFWVAEATAILLASRAGPPEAWAALLALGWLGGLWLSGLPQAIRQ